jgi:hypothetical protein
MTAESQPVDSVVGAHIDLTARDWVSGIGLLGVGAALLSASSTSPVGSLLILALAGVVRSSPGAFVIGQIALLPSLTAVSPMAGVAQLGLLAVVTEPTRDPVDPLALSAAVVSFGGLIGLVVVRAESPLIVGGLVCLAVGGSLYGIHRVTLVRLGLVGSPDTSTEPFEPNSEE